MKKLIWLAIATGSIVLVLAQQPDFSGIVSKRTDLPKMAIIDFHGAGDSQKYTGAFNQTLWNDIESSGLFNMVSKSFYPAKYPQQPSDFQTPPPTPTTPVRPKRGQPPPPTSGNGLWMSDWSAAGVAATYLTFGYAAAQNDVFVVRGFVFDLRRPTPGEAQVIGKTYTAS